MLLSNTDHLSSQMDRITRCLSTFIEEQKSFNQQIEERLSKSLNTNVNNQFQQQVVTQGLLVNLNTAYREIAVLQAEINALQSENTRLTSSISFDQQYHQNSSMHKFDQTMSRNDRPQPRSHLNEYFQQETSRQKSHVTSDDINSSPDRPMSFDEQNIKLEKQTPMTNERSGPSEDICSPRPNPVCTRYVCRQENKQTYNFDRMTSSKDNEKDDEQFDDLSYMLSAISHPYKNIEVCKTYVLTLVYVYGASHT